MSNHESLEQERERLLATASPEEWEDWIGRDYKVKTCYIRREGSKVLESIIKRDHTTKTCLMCKVYGYGLEPNTPLKGNCSKCTRVLCDCRYQDYDRHEPKLSKTQQIINAHLRLERLGILPVVKRPKVQEERKEEVMNVALVQKVLYAHPWNEDRTAGDSRAWFATHTPRDNIESFSKGITYVTLLAKNVGDCNNREGKTFFGIALFRDGHAEMRYFIGGQCPWFVYKEEKNEPKGYEQYGAFTWKGYLYCREELLHYMGDYSIIGDAPEGYWAVPFLRNTSDAVQNLSKFPSYITKKEF